MSDPTTATLDREARLRALIDQLRPAAEQVIQQMAAELIDRPDRELFGEVEYRLREAAHELAATAHQTGLEARKKGGTSGRPGSARGARRMPGSIPGGPAGC